MYETFAELAAKKSKSERQLSATPPAPPALAQPKPTISSSPAPLSPSPLDMVAAPMKSSTGRPLSTIEEGSFSADQNRATSAADEADGLTVEPGKDDCIYDKENDRSNERCSNTGDDVTQELRESQQSPVLQEQMAHGQRNRDEDEIDGSMNYVPEPREPIGVVPVGFTVRLFPTPLRESKVADESAWIMKNRRHLHKNKTLVGRLPVGQDGGLGDLPVDISESDPVWLKGKGDDLYRAGDFLGAVNAYTTALEADPENPAPCLSNRAACHLRLGKAAECAADCGAALQILQSIPESGLSQAKVFARRAMAYHELGHYRLSLEDCRAALTFSPGDPALMAQAEELEPLVVSETAKKEAVARFSSGNIEGACEMYDAALAAVPALPSCLSNRAACHLALSRPAECVRDCTSALDLLSADPSPDSSGSGSAGDESGTARDGCHDGINDLDACGSGDGDVVPPICAPPPGSAPPAGSEKRRLWVLATVMRRGRANLELGNLKAALQDYRAASALAPDDKDIARDVMELERQAQEEDK